MEITDPQLINLITRFGWLLAGLIITDLILKAISLWHAARANQKTWYICLLIFNTLAILPIIFLMFYSKPAQSTSPAK